MAIEFDEKHLEVQQNIREFVQREVAPLSAELDAEQKSAAPILKKLGKELAYTAVVFPKEYGGAGLDFESYAIVLEEVAKVDPAVAAAIAIQNPSQEMCYLTGSEELKNKVLPLTTQYDELICSCLTEEGAGSDPAGLKTMATEDGDYYVLNGEKRYISMGDQSRFANVFAITVGADGKPGISAFLVDREESPFEVVKTEDKLGLRACTTATLRFDNVRVPKANMMGTPGKGLSAALAGLDKGRLGVAAIALGCAEGALDAAIEHAKTRVQFGKPIGTKQAIQFMIADMAKNIEASRTLVYNAVRRCDAGLPFSVEASTAKLFASQTAVSVASDSVQIHGGQGLMKGGSIAERLYRDAKFLEIIEGTSQVQRIVISRAMLGKLK